MEVDWTVFESVLLWIVAGGSVFIVNYGLAYLAENFAFWHKLPIWLKFLIPIVVSVLLAFGAQQLLLYPDVIAYIQPIWALGVTILLAWLGSQKGYISAKSANYGAEKRIK